MTRSEAMFFTAGLVIGAAAGAISPSSRRSSALCFGRPRRRRRGVWRVVLGNGQEGGGESRSGAGRHGRDEASGCGCSSDRPGPRRLTFHSSEPSSSWEFPVTSPLSVTLSRRTSTFRLNSPRDQGRIKKNGGSPLRSCHARVKPALHRVGRSWTTDPAGLAGHGTGRAQGQSWTSRSASPVRADPS